MYAGNLGYAILQLRLAQVNFRVQRVYDVDSTLIID